MSVFGNRAFMEVTGVKCGPKGKALIPSDWYPYENKTHHNSLFLTHMQSRRHAMIQREGGHLQARKKPTTKTGSVHASVLDV